MKRLFTALFCSLSLCSFAQSDSVSLGAGANNMVFYNLSSGAQSSAPNNDWHLAFAARYISGFTYQSTSQAAAIRINEAYGLKLYRCPNQNLAQFATLDTTGWQSWQQMHNPDTSWTIGAFNINRNESDQFNYGWGEYNQGDHNIYGDSSVYLIQLPDGSFKKFAILTLIFDQYFNVQYSNLDNTAFDTLDIPKAPYNGKNFVYLNLNTNALLDKEPPLSDWDFMALRYTNNYDSSNVTKDIGILTKDVDNVYVATGADAQQNCYNGTAYANEINLIGHSWMGAPADTVIPAQAYFVSGPSGTYKLAITGFGGAATGMIDFTDGICTQTTSGISQLSASGMNVSVYPVPASDQINLKVNSTVEINATIELLDMTGRTIISQNGNMMIGENNYAFNLSTIQPGNYIIAITTATGKENRMISIVR
jgi:hypothetical protein